MATITTKYEVGQKVWVAAWESADARFTCPDCEGQRHWTVTTPSGEVFPIECQTCRRGYQGSTGTIHYYKRTLTPWEGTIGSVQVNTAEKDPKERVRYMLVESGVGTGRIWYEHLLCESLEEAEAIARADIERLEAKDAEDRERRAKNSRKDIFYVRKRGERLRDELEKVIRLLHAEAAPVDQKLFNRMERVLKRNAGFREL